MGTYALSAGFFDAFYGSAQKVRTLIQRDFAQAFEQVDALIAPTTPNTAWEFGAENRLSPMEIYLSDVTTIPANLAGIPAMSLPAGLADDGLPVGLQLLAPARADERLYQIGSGFEAALNAARGGSVLDNIPALAADKN